MLCSQARFHTHFVGEQRSSLRMPCKETFRKPLQALDFVGNCASGKTYAAKVATVWRRSCIFNKWLCNIMNYLDRCVVLESRGLSNHCDTVCGRLLLSWALGSAQHLSCLASLHVQSTCGVPELVFINLLQISPNWRRVQRTFTHDHQQSPLGSVFWCHKSDVTSANLQILCEKP